MNAQKHERLAALAALVECLPINKVQSTECQKFSNVSRHQLAWGLFATAPSPGDRRVCGQVPNADPEERRREGSNPGGEERKDRG
jgi:hypothetical protein